MPPTTTFLRQKMTGHALCWDAQMPQQAYDESTEDDGGCFGWMPDPWLVATAKKQPSTTVHACDPVQDLPLKKWWQEAGRCPRPPCVRHFFQSSRRACCGVWQCRASFALQQRNKLRRTPMVAGFWGASDSAFNGGLMAGFGTAGDAVNLVGSQAAIFELVWWNLNLESGQAECGFCTPEWFWAT